MDIPKVRLGFHNLISCEVLKPEFHPLSEERGGVEFAALLLTEGSIGFK